MSISSNIAYKYKILIEITCVRDFHKFYLLHLNAVDGHFFVVITICAVVFYIKVQGWC